MLLVIDVGNTNMKLGVYDGDVLKKSWRLSTEAKRTADELGMILYDLFKNVGVEFQDIDGIIMSSVAPMLNYTVEHMCTYYMKKKPVFVDDTLKTGLKIKYNNPIELGADRIVDAVGAHFIYGGPIIVVDFGSATTFNAVTADGTFLGGAICAGVKTASESLVNTAAKLPRFELVPPKDAIARSTIEGMQSGAVYGYAGQVDYIVRKFRENPLMKYAKVIATGGLSELVVNADKSIIDVVDRSLSLKGLKILYDMNKEGNNE